MQIGDVVGNTVFAYNAWDNPSEVGDLGIGNDPRGGNPDWTFSGSIGTYSVKEVEVFVNDQPSSVPEPATIGLFGSALVGMFLRRRKG
jgi:hypothetical protein